jgi:ABC-type amino acid transport system permease subunit
MIELIVEQAPRFFVWNNIVLLAQGAGVTLLLTALGCGIGAAMGFLAAHGTFVLAIALAPPRAALC